MADIKKIKLGDSVYNIVDAGARDLIDEIPRGTVTSVGTGDGLTGGPITESGSIALNMTYVNTNISVDQSKLSQQSGDTIILNGGTSTTNI